MRRVFQLAAGALAVGPLAAAGCASARSAPEGLPPSTSSSGFAAASEPSTSAAAATFAEPPAPASALEDAVAAANEGTPPARTPEEPADGKGWRVEFTPFLWVPRIEGTLGVGQLEGGIDMSIGDFVDALTDHGENLAVLHAEVKNDRFGVLGELIYLDLEGEGERTRTFGGQQIGPITVPTRNVTIEADVGFKFAMAELGLTYTLGDVGVTGAVEGRAHFELIGGVRRYEVENTVDLTPGPDVKIEEEWYDPFVGMRCALPLGESVALTVRGDVGGFGLGDASEASYRLTAMLRWDVSKHVAVLAGWSLLDVDYETGSGRNAFAFDIRMSGPAAAVSIVF